MTRVNYQLEVDWAGAGDFSGAEDDVTSDLFNVECQRGRDYASQLTGRATAGRLVAQLKNLDGKYSSFNVLSPIYGNILPGRKIRLRGAVDILWTGFLNRIIPAASINGIPTAELDAVGPIEKIRGKKINPPALTNALTGAVINAILDNAEWPAGDREINDGQTEILHWFAFDKDALDTIRDVEETELGFFYEDKDGGVVYEDRHHRLKGTNLISQATFADDGTGNCGFRAIEQQDPLREIYNEVFAVVAPYILITPAEVLWTFRESNPTLAPGQSVTYWAGYPNVGVDSGIGAYASEWITPVVGVDITQTGVADLDITVDVVKFSNSMKIEITNNNASSVATLTLIQARGEPVRHREEIRISGADSVSQNDFGIRTFRLSGPWLPNTNIAKDFTDYVLSRYKDPLPVIRMSFKAIKNDAYMLQALTRKISDRITVTAQSARFPFGINTDFFIEAIGHRITYAGSVHEVFYDLSDATGDSGYWILGVAGFSELGETTRLAY